MLPKWLYAFIGVLGKIFSKFDDNSTPMANDILAQRNRYPALDIYMSYVGIKYHISRMVVPGIVIALT